MTPDFEALNAICCYCGLVLMDGNSEPIPLVGPLGDFESPSWDQMEFDAAVCRAGIKKFIRPLSPADQPPPPTTESFNGPHLLVAELAPGVRYKRSVSAYLPAEAASSYQRPTPKDRAARRRRNRRRGR